MARSCLIPGTNAARASIAARSMSSAGSATISVGRLSESFLRSDVDSSWLVCLYAFMRTTVELPPDLMRAAKARSAELGESLKSLFARAVAAELSAESGRPRARERVRLPLIVGAGGRVNPSSGDLARALADADAASVAARPGRPAARPERRRR